MALTDFTAYADIRAVLGVSEPEIPDTVLSRPVYSVMLREDLREMNTSLEADFLTTAAISSPSADQTRFVELTQTYSAYRVGQDLVDKLPMFAPILIKDHSSENRRMLDPYQNMRKSISDSLTYLRPKLLAAYEAAYPSQIAPVIVKRVLVGSVGLGADPITGA